MINLTAFPTTGIASVDILEFLAGFLYRCMAAGIIPQVFQVLFFWQSMTSFFMYFIFMEDAVFSMNIRQLHDSKVSFVNKLDPLYGIFGKYKTGFRKIGTM